MCLKRDTNRSLQWLEREISPAGGIRGDCHGERGSCTGQWCAHVAGAGASGQSLGLPAHSLLKENWLTLGSLFWITGLQELAYFCLKKVNIMLSPACRGTFGGRRKAVRDRLALQGGTGDFP